jgi:hypothetical protein
VPKFYKWCSSEEQLTANVVLHSTLSPFMLLVIFKGIRVVVTKLRFSGVFGTGNSSLCGTNLISDGKYDYFIVCLDLKVIGGDPCHVC